MDHLAGPMADRPAIAPGAASVTAPLPPADPGIAPSPQRMAGPEISPPLPPADPGIAPPPQRVGGPEIAPRPRRLAGPLSVGLALSSCAALLAVLNPDDDGVPLCPTRALTGLDCPLCGGLRAVAALGRGSPVRAADHNLLVAVGLPVVTAWLVVWIVSSWRGRPVPGFRWTRTLSTVVVTLGVVFTLVRNLPLGPAAQWLASPAG